MSNLLCSEFVILDDTSPVHAKNIVVEFVGISMIVDDSPAKIRADPPDNSNPGVR